MDPTTNIMEQSLWEADNMVLLLKKFSKFNGTQGSLWYAQRPTNAEWNLWTLHVCDSICFQTLTFFIRVLSVQYNYIIEVTSVNIQSQNNWFNIHRNVCMTLKRTPCSRIYLDQLILTWLIKKPPEVLKVYHCFYNQWHNVTLQKVIFMMLSWTQTILIKCSFC